MIEYTETGNVKYIDFRNFSLEEKVKLLKEAQKSISEYSEWLEKNKERPVFPITALYPVDDNASIKTNENDIHNYFHNCMESFIGEECFIIHKDSPNLFKSVGEYFIKLGEYAEKLKIHKEKIKGLTILEREIKESLGIK